MKFLLSCAKGEFSFQIGTITQPDNRLAVEYKSYIPLKNGNLYNNTYHSLFVVEHGKITVLHEHLDTLHIHEALHNVKLQTAAASQDSGRQR